MGYPRKSLVCLNDTPYYHVVACCVRRAWLWGVDEYAGRDYSHRKQWVINRLEFLALGQQRIKGLMQAQRLYRTA